MVSVTFVDHDGTAHKVDAKPGLSLMEAALGNGVRGILADCGGAMSCATCRVDIGSAWQDLVGPPNEFETAMIEVTVDPTDATRLSCQITLTTRLDGLIVNLPASQF